MARAYSANSSLVFGLTWEKEDALYYSHKMNWHIFKWFPQAISGKAPAII